MSSSSGKNDLSQFGRGQIDLKSIRRRRAAKKAMEAVSRQEARAVRPQEVGLGGNDLTRSQEAPDNANPGAIDTPSPSGPDSTAVVGSSKVGFVGDPRYSPIHLRGSVVD